MSSNRIVLILISIYIFMLTPLQAIEQNVTSEDELIIRGLFFDNIRAYQNSREIYEKLYNDTKLKNYLFREAKSALMSNTFIEHTLKRVKEWDKKYPNEIEAKRLLIPLYLSNREIQKSKQEAEYLLELSSEAIDLDLASNPYMYSGEFNKTVELLNSAYEQSLNEGVLLRMSIIMNEYTNDRDRAIQLLETHRRINILVSNELYFQLISLYIKNNDIDGILSTYKALYKNNDNEKYLIKIIEAYAYKGDINGAIEFLEQSGQLNETLYDLYKNRKDFDKALNLLSLFYKKDNNPIWLAEKAILIFEKAENKNDMKMIQDVIKYFDKAILLGVDDSIYLNYYGYTLIDKGIDIKKGMKIISDALIQQPDNTYYLDSLAWGHYKIHACDKAYNMMKQVVDMEGLDEPEIAEHWKAIQDCK